MTAEKDLNQPQQDSSHPVCENTDVGGGYVSSLSVLLVEVDNTVVSTMGKAMKNYVRSSLNAKERENQSLGPVENKEGNRSLKATTHPIYM